MNASIARTALLVCGASLAVSLPVAAGIWLVVADPGFPLGRVLVATALIVAPLAALLGAIVELVEGSA